MRLPPCRFAAIVVALFALAIGSADSSRGQDPGGKAKGKKDKSEKARLGEDDKIAKMLAKAERKGKDGEQTDKAIEKLFSQLDRNGDGVLSTDEMPEALSATKDRWDTNHDGVIDLAEYRMYVAGRMRQVQDERNGADSRRSDSSADERKPAVYRAGKLPQELPAWFAQLDTDNDGQVGLYEWKDSGWPVEDFQRLDRNGDGFLTVAEVLWHVAQAKDRDTPEKALLSRTLSSRPTSSSDGSTKVKKKGGA